MGPKENRRGFVFCDKDFIRGRELKEAIFG